MRGDSDTRKPTTWEWEWKQRAVTQSSYSSESKPYGGLHATPTRENQRVGVLETREAIGIGIGIGCNYNYNPRCNPKPDQDFPGPLWLFVSANSSRVPSSH